MTREKSRGLQTPVSRLFHSFGQRAAACSAFRCSRATIVDSLLASISMLTWCYSSGPNGVKAFLWTAGAGVQNLGTLSGGSDCKARDINDSNEVVGTVKTVSGDRAVLWTKVGQCAQSWHVAGRHFKRSYRDQQCRRCGWILKWTTRSAGVSMEQRN